MGVRKYLGVFIILALLAVLVTPLAVSGDAGLADCGAWGSGSILFDSDDTGIGGWSWSG